MPLISIIVPVYKVEKYLDRCVQSIIGQTYRELEIILVDDGSPDECPQMCDDWARRDSRIRAIHKQNGGLSDARNAGMAVATGEYIGFVDSDDWIAPDMYERLYQKAVRDNCDITACAVEMVFEDGTPPRSLTHNSKEAVYSREEAMEELLRERELLQPVWYKLYCRATIESLSFPKEKFHEDVFWSYQAIGAASRIGVICNVGYYYWQRKGSIMSELYSEKRFDSIEAKLYRQVYLEQTMPQLAGINSIDIWFSCMYQGQQLQRSDLNRTKKREIMMKLKSAIKQGNLTRDVIKAQTATHRLWIFMTVISLQFTCLCRNVLKIGM